VAYGPAQKENKTPLKKMSKQEIIAFPYLKTRGAPSQAKGDHEE